MYPDAANHPTTHVQPPASSTVASKSRPPLAGSNPLAYNQFPKGIGHALPRCRLRHYTRSHYCPVLFGNSGVRRSGFPRPIGRGPIEATLISTSRAAIPSFPRPIGRGPIEAAPSRGGHLTSFSFRVRSDAAPLKHRLHRDPAPRHTAFPRPIGRGPIEAVNGDDHSITSSSLSASDRTRPH